MMPLDVKIPLSYVLLLTVSSLTIIAMLRWGKTSDADYIGLEAKLRTTTISGGRATRHHFSRAAFTPEDFFNCALWKTIVSIPQV
jgi:hypothetical protein